MKYRLLLITILLAGASVYAQQDSSVKARERIYNVHPKYELPAATAGLILFSTVALPAVIKHASITEAELTKLNPADVHWFDRPVIFNSFSKYSTAISRSDVILNASLLSPALLMLDKKVRKDWLQTISLYLLTHAINNTVFLAATTSVRRVRPLVYNTEVPLEQRTGKGKKNSFYSGHVSNAAASTFFLVKVYTDYHHIKGWKRILLYGGAAVPPALIGHYRLQAGRHYRTDILAGFLVGATSGILVPELHRIGRSKKISMDPFYSPESAGVSFKLTLP